MLDYPLHVPNNGKCKSTVDVVLQTLEDHAHITAKRDKAVQVLGNSFLIIPCKGISPRFPSSSLQSRWKCRDLQYHVLQMC
jgi:hypothetical protein